MSDVAKRINVREAAASAALPAENILNLHPQYFAATYRSTLYLQLLFLPVIQANKNARLIHQ